MEKKKSIRKAFSWSFLDRITTQLFSTIVSIILARMIDPEHYGIIAMATIVVELLDVFVNPGLCSALVQKKDSRRIDFSTMFWFNFSLSILLFLIGFAIAPIVETFYNIDYLCIVIRVLLLKIPFAALNSIQMAYVQKNFLYKRYFWVSSIGTVLAAVVGICMAILDYGVWALVAYSLGNTVIDALLALFFVPWKPHLEFSKSGFKGMFSFGQKVFLVKLFDLVYEELSGLIIGKKYTSGDLACYKKGKKFPQLIANNIIASLGDVLFPSLSDVQDDSEQLLAIMGHSAKLGIYVIFPCLFGFFACADNFISLLLTDKWLPCVPYLRITCINLLCIPMSTIIYQGIKAIGRGGVLLKVETSKKTYGITILLLTVVITNNPIYISAAMAVIAFISLIVDFCIAKRYLKFSIKKHFRDNYKVFIICVAMTTVVLAVGGLTTSAFFNLLVQIGVGIAVYAFLSIVLKVEQFGELLNIGKGMLKK